MAVTGVLGGTDELEQHRRELTGYCYRMLGSVFEADDAVQETIIRAWKGADAFEGRSSVRSWLYRIATNVCLDMLRSRQRRALPMDLGPSSSTADFTGSRLDDSAWLTPIPDGRFLDGAGDPSLVAEARATIRLAFVAALQHLPPRQRSVLLLREVLRLQTTEVAELLDTTVQSVNSALQRARATLAERGIDDDHVPAPVTAEQAAALDDYVEAFERYDVARLVSLLKDDVVMAMPPYDFWITGTDEVARWLVGPGAECEGSKIFRVEANGRPALAQYRIDPAGGWKPWAVHLYGFDGDRISSWHAFVDPALFPVFGLASHLD